MLNNLHLRGSALAFWGIFIISFDALLVRVAGTTGATIIFWRGLFIALSLSLIYIARNRRTPFAVIAGNLKPYLVSSLLFSVSGGGFVISVMNTRVANTTVILSTAPFFAALLSYFLNKERVRPHTLFAMMAMVLGTLVIVSSATGSGRLFGDFMAVVTACFMGAGQAYLRRHQSLERIPVILLNGGFLALFALYFADLQPGGISLAVLALMGLVQMPLAMVLVAMATRYISAAETSMFSIVETVLGPLWVFICLGEQVPFRTFGGGLLIIGALVVNTILSSKAERRSAWDG